MGHSRSTLHEEANGSDLRNGVCVDPKGNTWLELYELSIAAGDDERAVAGSEVYQRDRAIRDLDGEVRAREVRTFDFEEMCGRGIIAITGQR